MLIVYFLVFFAFGLRTFFYKPIAKKYPPAIAMLTDGVGGVILSIVLVLLNKENIRFVWHPILLISFLNGALLSYQVKFFQIVLKESTSAHQYIIPSPSEIIIIY